MEKKIGCVVVLLLVAGALYVTGLHIVIYYALLIVFGGLYLMVQNALFPPPQLYHQTTGTIVEVYFDPEKDKRGDVLFSYGDADGRPHTQRVFSRYEAFPDMTYDIEVCRIDPTIIRGEFDNKYDSRCKDLYEEWQRGREEQS